MTIEISELDNGLRVVTDTMLEAESIVVGAWVGVGTRHEPWRANGVAHLVEHMMFKGTKKRSAYALSTAIEKNGGMINAHTTREETAYYARVLPEDLATVCDVVADMLRHSLFNLQELEREKKVIIQEIGRDLDSPEDHIFDLVHKVAFPKQTIGRSVLGSVDVIQKLPRSVIIEYVHRYYCAANMVIVGAGRLDHKSFVAHVKKRFGSLAKGKLAKREKAYMAGGVHILPKDIEQLHMVMAFGGASLHSHDVYATQLLGILLGGNTSSRLFQKVREKRGLVYTVSAGHAALQDIGLFQIYAGTDPARIQELIPVICQELKDVSSHITSQELARAKAQCRADVLMGKENVMRRAEVLGHQLLAYQKPIASEKVLDKLVSVTVDQTQNIAKKLFSQKSVFTVMGPTKNLGMDNPIDRIMAS